MKDFVRLSRIATRDPEVRNRKASAPKKGWRFKGRKPRPVYPCYDGIEELCKLIAAGFAEDFREAEPKLYHARSGTREAAAKEIADVHTAFCNEESQTYFLLSTGTQVDDLTVAYKGLVARNDNYDPIDDARQILDDAKAKKRAKIKAARKAAKKESCAA